MPKDRSQMTPEDPEDWAKIQSGRGQGTGGTGYDRLPGEEAPPHLHDRDSTAETIPEPLDDQTVSSSDRDRIADERDRAWRDRAENQSGSESSESSTLGAEAKELSNEAVAVAKKAGRLASTTARSLMKRFRGN